MKNSSHIIIFSDTLEMPPRETASIIAPFCIVFKVLNMASDLDGMISDLSTSKNTNIMKELRMET